jgi:hypothetical protein
MPNIKLRSSLIVFGPSTQTSHFNTFCKQSRSCSCNLCSTHMRAPSQSYSIPSLQISLVLMGKSFTHADILFWNARCIKSKKYGFLNYVEVNSLPVALISETRLQLSMKFKSANYKTYRSDRLNQRPS